jgi:hypothetical protein
MERENMSDRASPLTYPRGFDVRIKLCLAMVLSAQCAALGCAPSAPTRSATPPPSTASTSTTKVADDEPGEDSEKPKVWLVEKDEFFAAQMDVRKTEPARAGHAGLVVAHPVEFDASRPNVVVVIRDPSTNRSISCGAGMQQQGSVYFSLTLTGADPNDPRGVPLDIKTIVSGDEAEIQFWDSDKWVELPCKEGKAPSGGKLLAKRRFRRSEIAVAK